VAVSVFVPLALVNMIVPRSLPVIAAENKPGDAMSENLTILRSVPCPLPDPPQPAVVYATDNAPNDHDWRSISSACDATVDSPGIEAMYRTEPVETPNAGSEGGTVVVGGGSGQRLGGSKDTTLAWPTAPCAPGAPSVPARPSAFHDCFVSKLLGHVAGAAPR